MNRYELELSMRLGEISALEVLRVMARRRPEDLTYFAISIVRDHDHAEALLELDEVEA
jgi:hypothetical protein